MHLDRGAVVPCDKDLMVQAIHNVIDNACHAVAEGAEGRGRVSINIAQEGEYVEIRVEENGQGVPPAEEQCIFDPLHGTKAFGVGLGLGIARQIAKIHSGTLELQPHPPRGTAAVLRLPTHMAQQDRA
jgi:signal transduction histidine kinase